jgi:hypothetical protein
MKRNNDVVLLALTGVVIAIITAFHMRYFNNTLIDSFFIAMALSMIGLSYIVWLKTEYKSYKRGNKNENK